MKNKHLLSGLAFVLGAIIILGAVQRILVPYWSYPRYNENISHTLKDYYMLDKGSVDVIFLGTSQVVYGVSPMEVYESENIISYNLGTSAQSLELSYYLLVEALKTQTPKLVMLDGSTIFLNGDKEEWWRYSLDVMPISSNKIAMAKQVACLNETDNFSDSDMTLDSNKQVMKLKSIFSVLLPFFKYHDRWDEIGKTEFIEGWGRDKYCTNGYNFCTEVIGSDISIDVMNNKLEELKKDNYMNIIEINEGSKLVKTKESKLYGDLSISQKKYLLLEKMKKLCDSKGIRFVLMKVPSASNNPAEYNPCWTLDKSRAVELIANDMLIDYIDMIYGDETCSINWEMDTPDRGGHLNYLGALKVSSFLANVLKNRYGIKSTSNDIYDEDLDKYIKIKQIADIQSSYDFSDWLKRINNYDGDYELLITGYRNWTDAITDEELSLLNGLGLMANIPLHDMYGQSYISIVCNNEPVYEAVSNRKLEYSYCDDEIGKIFIKSNGITYQVGTSIMIDDEEYCVNNFGLNFVLYDKTADCVVDTVSFDTSKSSIDRLVVHQRQRNCLNRYIYMQKCMH